MYLAISGSESLQCWDCGYFKASSDNILADFALKQINRLSNDACQLRNAEDENNVDIRYVVLLAYYT